MQLIRFDTRITICYKNMDKERPKSLLAHWKIRATKIFELCLYKLIPFMTASDQERMDIHLPSLPYVTMVTIMLVMTSEVAHAWLFDVHTDRDAERHRTVSVSEVKVTLWLFVSYTKTKWLSETRMTPSVTKSKTAILVLRSHFYWPRFHLREQMWCSG